MIKIYCVRKFLMNSLLSTKVTSAHQTPCTVGIFPLYADPLCSLDGLELHQAGLELTMIHLLLSLEWWD